jgi:hypothetical protein
MFMV